MTRTVVLRFLFCMVAVLLAQSAEAFDCLQARTALEKATCADPEAKASDERMEEAFRSAMATVPADQKAGLLANQRGWLKERNDDCAVEPKPAACAAVRNQDRRLVLLAQPKAGPGLSQKLVPVIVNRPGTRDKIATDIVLFRFADARTPAGKVLNPLIDKFIADAPVEKDVPEDREWNNDLKASIAYASDDLLSIPVATWNYSGGPHGTYGMTTLNIAPRIGRVLTFADLASGKKEDALFQICLDQIVAQEKEKSAVPTDPDAIRSRDDGLRNVLTDLKSWTFTATQAEITFDPYTVGSYVEGPYACAIAYGQLKSLAKPGFPVP